MKKNFLILAVVMFANGLVNLTAWATDKYVVATGNWSATSTWSLTRGGASGAAVPGASDNVIIPSPFIVTLDASGKNCLNLTVESGATLRTGVTLPTSTLAYLRINGTTADIEGTFGNATAPGDAIGMENYNVTGSMTITGAGTFAPARVRTVALATATTTTTIFDIDTKFMYAGSSGTGGVALYAQVSSTPTTPPTITVNAGKTLTFVDKSGLSTSSSQAAVPSPVMGMTLNINGTLNFSGTGSSIFLLGGTGQTCTTVIGATGTLTVNGPFYFGDGTFTNSGTLTYGASSTLSYVGTAAQSTGVEFPSSGPANLTLNNSAGVTINGSHTLTGMLNLGGNNTYTNLNNVSGYTGITYSATTAQTTGAEFGGSITNLTINNSHGVTLGGSEAVTGTLTMTAGNISLGGNTLTLGTAIAFPGTLTYTAGYITGTGTFTRWFANGAIAGNTGLFPFGVGTSNRSLAIGGSPSAGGPIAASYNDASTVSSITFSENAQSFVNRYDANWVVTPSGGYTDGAMTLTIHGDGISGITSVADLDLSAASTIATGVWLAPSGSTSAPVLTRNGLTQGTIVVNPFYISSVVTSLPVELTSFTGSANGRNVQLLWATATEINNSGFEVQKNANGSWTKIGFVDGAGTSNAPHSYSFTDVNSAASKYSYRLKQVDRDGKIRYSSVVEVATTLTASDFALSQNYPNPFNPSTKFTFASKNAEQTTLKIYNVAGQEVATLFNGVAQPSQVYTLTFDAKDLPSGMYFYVLHSASRNDVKKMMLLK